MAGGIVAQRGSRTCSAISSVSSSMRDGEAAATPASDRRRTGIRQLSGTSVRYKTPAVGVRLGTFTGHCWDPTTRTLTSRLRTLAGLQCACGRPAADTHDRRGATVPPNRVVRYAGHPSVRASDSYHPAFRTAGHRTLERGLPCLLTPMRHHRGQRASGRRSTTTPSSPTPTMIGRSPQASRSG